MFAVVRSGGKQFKVTEGMRIKVPTLPLKVGEEETLSEILLLSDGEKKYSGSPIVRGAQVRVEVVRHGREDKRVIFKYNRRKDYHLKKGHRQGYTEVIVKSIVVPAGASAAKPAPAVEKQPEAAGEKQAEASNGQD